MTSVSASDDKTPQDALNNFWETLITKNPGKVTNIFPSSLYADFLAPQRKRGPAKGKNAADSYQAAADECRARVERIVRECHRTNEKFTDPEFDVESDFTIKNCLEGIEYWLDDSADGGEGEDEGSVTSGGVKKGGLRKGGLRNGGVKSGSSSSPGSVHRIDWVFDNPSFTIDGFSSSDVKQGANGDCWFIAALATICSNPGLMDRICVERDEECGVYGFVFYRDGEWIWTIVDDNLYLNCCDFAALGDNYDPSGAKEKKYRRNCQTGSDALFFASCANQNETWLPLLEKAYAKVHGDYEAISGGISGEAVEDLTGGVTTKVMTNRILSKERLWKELVKVNKDFLFSASSPGAYGDDTSARQGLALNHAYSVLKAVEESGEDGQKYRLVLIRNPWGERANASIGEWNGAWSDGSKEWTPYWMEKLNHRFGDDGLFWMSYDDLCTRFELLDRTRLFDKEWTVVQEWTSVSVAWVTGYLNTKFVVEIRKMGPTVFVLCQLDDRYFKGLEGKYSFDLHFVLQDVGASSGEHIVRARGAWFGNRSISAEVDLEPGVYEIVPKIVAWRDADATDVYDVVTQIADLNPQKLRQIGMNYDIANAKGVVEVSAEEEKKKKEKKKKEREEKERREKKDREEKERREKKDREEAEKEKAEFEAWRKEKKEKEEEKEEKEKKDAGKDAKQNDDKTPGAETEIKSESTRTPDISTTTTTAEATSKHKEQPDTELTPPPPTHTNDPSPFHSHRSTPLPNHDYGATHDTYEHQAEAEAAAAAETPAPAPAPQENKQNPWNAVCVLGLRVYSLDPEVSIKLVKPKNAEEAAVLDADGGGTVVGATM